MLEKEIQDQLIQNGRQFMKGYRKDDPYMDLFESDQERKLPQPPLVKAPMTSAGKHTPLPRDYSGLTQKRELPELMALRKSTRIYTQEEMSLSQLSFLLWATQGVKSLRGKAYATLRTVPSGGARHPFETYLAVRKVQGLEPGKYHYLPMEHALEYLGPISDQQISESLSDQIWAAKANVVFYWSVVPYRAEWRYGIYSHRIALIDMGHVGQSLYTACAGMGLGCCGIGAFEQEQCDQLFDLDGQEEFVVYTTPVGTLRESDKDAEQAFYRFVQEEGL